MKAIKVHELGGPEVLQVEDVEKPTVHANEVLIEVHASSLNPVDAKSIQPGSKYESELQLPITPGMDVAGIVESVGEGVNNLIVGDRVYGQASVLRNGSGAFAEYAVTSQDSISLMPANIGFIEAASVPLAASSAYEAIVHHMRLQTEQRILIHGGSGGIGSFAIQIAKHLGAYVIATATGEGIDFCRDLGADRVIDYKSIAFEEKLRDVDAVLDTIGGDTYRKSFSIVRPGGIIVSMLEKPDDQLVRQTGVRAVLEMTKISREVLSEIAQHIEEDAIKVSVSRVFSLEETPQAYRAKENEKILGKIAIDVKGEDE